MEVDTVSEPLSTHFNVSAGTSIEDIYGQKPRMENLEQILSECHPSTFDRAQSGLLSDEVLNRISNDEIIRKVEEFAFQLEWATDIELLADQMSWISAAEKYFDIQLFTSPLTESLKQLTTQSAKRKMEIARLNMLILLKMTRGSQRLFYKNITVGLFQICDQITEAIRMQLSSMARSDNTHSNVIVPKNKDLIFGFSWFDRETTSSFQELIIYMLSKLQSAGLRRVGEDCYVEICNADGNSTHAWRHACSIKNFVYEFANKDATHTQWSNLTQRSDSVHQLISYLNKCNDHEFPELQTNRDYISFNNGVYKLSANKFYEFANSKSESISESIVSMNYLNVVFDPTITECNEWQDIKTPILDSIFLYQGYDMDTIYWAYALIGRLFYEVGVHDNWQVCCFFKGIAGSGKSTIASLTKAVFPASSVGTLSSNVEKKFGLSALYDKLVYVCTEVKHDFALDQGDWQSMISGEDVSVAIKGETAISVKWTTPGMLCGNELPRWVDASGSVVRRIVMFDFEKRVKNGNPNLLQQLLADIGTFVCKVNRAYLDKVAKHGKYDIWSPGILSDKLHKYHHRLRCEVDALIAFIESGVVEKATDAIILESEFLSAYLRFRHDAGITSKIEWKKDHYQSAFTENGIEIKKKVEFPYPLPTSPKKKGNYVIGIRLKQLMST